ncbi:MAG: hypothetical protein V1899_02535 [Planctomycetota bacterium]
MDSGNVTDFSLFLKGYVWWIVIPLAALLAFLIVRLYRRETKPYLAAGRRLRILRATVIVLLVLLLSQPVLRFINAAQQKPVVVVLKDISTSMTIKDLHEPLERRVRTAVALGLLDKSLRDTQAEQAADAFAAAQIAAETAAASVRQALQLVQESISNASNAQDKISNASDFLINCVKGLQQSGKTIKAAPNTTAELFTTAKQHAQTADRLARELSIIRADASDSQTHLNEKLRLSAKLVQDIAKLIDTARTLQDRADRALGECSKPEVKIALEKLATQDRIAIVNGMLNKADNEAVKIVHYGFDTDLRAASDADAANKKPRDTDLATPLVRIAERHALDSIAAVVICTDGRHISGSSPENAARMLAARGIVVHMLGVGSQDSPPDICVARLEGTLSVFMEETIRLTANIHTAGFKGQKCLLTLSRGDKVLQQRELIIGAEGWRHENFELTADQSGPNVFIAAIKPLPGEALTLNNSAEAVVDVADDRLKVLLVDELPRWETRYVANLLRRERKMMLDERWLLSSDHLGPKPKALPQTEKALEEYEIVVLGDISPERFNEDDQKQLSKFVADQGGFLVLIAGPNSMPRSYLTGPISDILPIRLQSLLTTSALMADTPARVRVKLAPAGAQHEIVRILRDPALNEQLWPTLNELNWVMRPAYAKPGATPLLYTDDVRKDVVVAAQYFGAGRVLYVGTDGAWNWRYKVADRVHTFFWSQALRWGTSNRLVGGPRLKVGCDRRQVRPGEAVEILARPRGQDGKLVSDAILVAQLADAHPPQRVQMQLVPDSGGLYRGYLQNLPAGIHTVLIEVASPGFEGIQQDLQIIVRELAGQECIELARDTSRLAAMAKSGGGQYLNILDASKLFEQLAGQRKEVVVENNFEVWSSYPALALIVLLLALEWILRKRMGLA